MQSPRQTCVILSSQILPAGTTKDHILPWSFCHSAAHLLALHAAATRCSIAIATRSYFSFASVPYSGLSSLSFPPLELRPISAKISQTFHSAVELHVLPNCRGHFLFRHILSPADVTVPSKVDRVRPATIADDLFARARLEPTRVRWKVSDAGSQVHKIYRLRKQV